VAVNVVRPGATGEERERLMAELAEATTPYDAAGVLGLDEVIDPASTRQVLADDLGHMATRQPPPLERRPLSYWSTC
jgi:acetyl-CoA carboxylase carboxyltransferase component